MQPLSIFDIVNLGGDIVLPGVYLAYKKDGTIYFRSSITHMGKHISLGSYDSEDKANLAYNLAGNVLSNHEKYTIEKYPENCLLSFHKWVVLINYRDNKIYFRNPIYLRKNYFLYYMDQDMVLKFDVDDLFYYSHRKILRRGGYLFVSDYGMHINILSRYGIKNYAIPGVDYIYVNGDDTDYRFSNIEVINPYHGVSRIEKDGETLYEAKILINGNFIIGRYSDEIHAAIAYNKAADILQKSGLKKDFPYNYIEDIDEINYSSIYNRLRISERLLAYANDLP